jgi:hypothetical protein
MSMSDNTEAARRQAEDDFSRNQQAQMKTEQQLRDYTEREAYNGELARQRRIAEGNG